MDPQVEKKLKEAPNVREMLQELMHYYKLEDCVPGVGVRSALTVGLKSAIKMVKPQKR